MAIGFQDTTLGRFLKIAGILVATVTVTAIATALSAPAASAQETVLDAVENISQQRAGDYYRNRSAFSQIRFITGLGGFPDQRINRDSAALAGAYKELLVLQDQSTATVRVPDLPNPYTTSVQLLPTSQLNSRVVGSELNFEPLPRR